MKMLFAFMSGMFFPLFSSHHNEDVLREILRQREITQHVLRERLVKIDKQLIKLYDDIQKDDCPGELFFANAILVNDKDIISSALNELISNGIPATPERK